MPACDLLVLDDDAEVADYVRLALAPLELVVAVASALPEGPAPASRAALVDLILGTERLGLAAIARLAQDRPVAVMTGLPAGHPRVEAALAAGAQVLLSKPFTLAELRRCVREQLGLG